MNFSTGTENGFRWFELNDPMEQVIHIININ